MPGAKRAYASRGAFAPEVLLEISLPSNQRAQGIPGARCTRGLVCKSAQKNAHEHTGSAEAIRHSLRNGLRLISRSPRRSGFLVTVAGGVLTANLTPASRRQDHTTLPSASAPFVYRRIRVHRTPLRVRDVAQRPSVWSGMTRDIKVIWVRRQANNSEKQKYFCEGIGQ